MTDSSADAPSVIQLRIQNIDPASSGAFVVAALRQFEQQLMAGSLIVISEDKVRARILPIRR